MVMRSAVRSLFLCLHAALVGLGGVALLSVAPARAQFDAFAWTLDTAGSGSGFTSDDTMTIVGPDFGFGTGCPGGTTAAFTTTAPYAATVVVNYTVDNNDKGGSLYDWAVLLLDGEEIFLSGQCFDCIATFEVPAGATWGFGVHSFDCVAGPAVLSMSKLSFLQQVIDPDIAGTLTGEASGSAVAAASDVNGDGVMELLVGSPLADSPLADAGRARLLSGASGAVLRTFTGTQAGERLGASVSGGGDADGDGIADLLLGSPRFDGVGQDSGRVRVLSGADGHVLLQLAGAAGQDQFGTAAAFTGDLDADGRADLIVGAPQSDPAGRA
jgi:hypothetical protein